VRKEVWTNPKTGEEETREVANRRAGYDHTFAVPKSVSLYLSLNDDQALERIIQDAYAETMADIENEIEVQVHKGDEHAKEVSGNLVYASFVHRETRPVDGIPDPHYHIHGFVFNATYREGEKRWTALEIGETVANRTCYEALFFHRLAGKMIEAGYGIRRTDTHFELASVSKELVEKFSKRTKLIEELAREKYTILEAEARAVMKQTNMAFEDAFAQVLQDREKTGSFEEMKSGLGARNRQKKSECKLDTQEDLVASWMSQMTVAELQSLRPESVRGPSLNLLDVELAKDQTIEHAFAHVSVKRDRHVEALLLRRGLGRVSLEEAREFPSSDPRFIRPNPIGKLITTVEVEAHERASIATGMEGQGRYQALGTVNAWTIQNPLISADPEQSASIDYLLRSRDLAMSVQGPAGSGKTTFATEAVKAIETLSGRRVLVLAPSSSAADELRKLGFAAETFQLFAADTQLQELARAQVLWIDESSFLSVQQGRWLLDFARDHDCRVIAPGDTKQHHSVERGDWLRIMQRAGALACTKVSKIFRQQVPALRDAVYEMSQDRPEAGFDKLKAFGGIQQITDKELRLSEIAKLHMAATREGRSSLIVAPTHGECRSIADAVRKALKEQGLLDVEDHSITRLERLNLSEAQRRDAVNYEPGYVVEFHKIAKGVEENGRKEKRFRSGEQWRVVSRDPGGGVRVERDGQQRFLPLGQAGKFNVYKTAQLSVAAGDRIRVTKNFHSAGQKYRNNQVLTVTGIEVGKIAVEKGEIVSAGALHVDQGIAVTSHAAQGKTVDQVIVSAPVESFSQVNSAQFYVSMSRARYAMHLFTDSTAALREAVCRPSVRLSPLELTLRDLASKSPYRSFHPTIEPHQTQNIEKIENEREH
jgi:conjugative relaxase-like TrwC/TraI family protein